MRAIIFLLTLTFLSAISLDEVIKLALKNNYLLDSGEQSLRASEYRAKSSTSLFIPHFSFNYTYGYSAPQNRPSYDFNSINLGVNYNIFNGFKDYNSYQKMVVDRSVAENNLDSIKNDIVLNTKVTYIKVLENKEALKNAKDSIQLLELQLKQAKQFLNYGISDKSAVLSVDVGLANAKIEYSKIELLLDYNLNNLTKLSGYNFSINSIEDIKTSEDYSFDKEKILNEVYINNPQFKNINLNRIKNLFDLKIAKSHYYPTFNINAVKFWYFNGGGVANFNYGLQSQARLTLGWDFSNLFKGYYDMQEKRVNALALNAQLLDLKKDIEANLTKLLNDFEVAKKQYSLAQIAILQAEENYRIVSNKYKQNITNYIELLNAELLLTSAKSKLVAARYEIALSVAYIQHLQNHKF